MRVAALEVIPVSVPVETRLRTSNEGDAAHRDPADDTGTYDHLVVRVDLADGTRGYGEIAPHPDWPGSGTRETCRQVIEDCYRDLVTGEDVHSVARIGERLDRAAADFPFARSGIDVALHDAIGRLHGIPLYALLGGAVPEDRSLRIHHTVGIQSEAAVREEVEAAAARGIEDFKLKAGGPDLGAEVDRLAAVHDAVPGARIRIDANGAWTAAEAIQRIPALDDAAGGLELVEQPVGRGDLDGFRRVRMATSPPVMADESCYYPEDVARLADCEAVDVVNVKLSNAGGFVPAKRAAAVAEAHGLSCFAGGMLELGIGAAASAQFALSTPSIRYPTGILNRFAEHMLIEDPEDWAPSGPSVTIPDAPGLGVDVDENAIERYRVS